MTSLGFSAPEIHSVVPDEEACLFIPTHWYGEDGYFMFDTSTRLDLSVNGAGLRSGRLPMLRDRGGFTVHAAEETSILGRTRPPGEVTAFASSEQGTVLGRVGCRFFGRATIACDPAGPHIAVKDGAWSAPSAGFHRLAIAGDSGLPVTTQVRLSKSPHTEFLTLLSTGYATSFASAEVGETLRPGRASGGTRLALALPSGFEVEARIRTGVPMPEYAIDLGGPPLGLVLGMDVLRRFLTVLDFVSHAVWVRPYPRAT